MPRWSPFYWFLARPFCCSLLTAKLWKGEWCILSSPFANLYEIRQKEFPKTQNNPNKRTEAGAKKKSASQQLSATTTASIFFGVFLARRSLLLLGSSPQLFFCCCSLSFSFRFFLVLTASPIMSYVCGVRCHFCVSLNLRDLRFH